MYRAYGTCRTLVEDEWYGISSGCTCEDTLFIRLKNIDLENGEAKLTINGNIISTPGAPITFFPQSSGQMNYFELIDGDSIAQKGLPYGTYLCDTDDDDIAIDYEGALYGKISPSRDKIDMLIEWRVRQNPNAIFDTCYVTFRR